MNWQRKTLAPQALKLPLNLLPQLLFEAEGVVSQISLSIRKGEQPGADRLLAVRDVEALVLNSVAEVLAKLPFSEKEMAEMIFHIARPKVSPVAISAKSDGLLLKGELSSPKRGTLHVFLKEPAFAMGGQTMSFYDGMILDEVGELSPAAREIGEDMLVSIYEQSETGN